MPPLPSLTSRKGVPEIYAIVRTFESETESVLYRYRPRSEHIVLYALLGMIALALTLMALTKVDVVVSGQGRTQAANGLLYVQPFDKGIVREIRVKAGETVKKDQVIATLDPTFSSADLAKLEATRDSARADMERLEAEQAGQPYHPVAGNHFELMQESIYQQRQSLYRSSIANYDAQIQNGQATINQFEQDSATYRQRLKVNADVEKMRTDLAQMGWGSKLAALNATDARMEVERLMSFSANQIQNTQHAIEALKAQRATFIDQWNSQIAQWIANDRNTIAQTQEDLQKAQKAHDLITILAPADAYVLKVGKVSQGAIVGPEPADLGADPMFTLVPYDAALEIEVAIDARDIGFIRTGETVDIKFDAYQFIRYGMAEGVLKSISQDSFTQDDSKQATRAYYKGRVAVTELQLHDVPSDFRLIPGMTVVADIKAGKRSILSYVIEGVMKEASEGMREP